MSRRKRQKKGQVGPEDPPQLKRKQIKNISGKVAIEIEENEKPDAEENENDNLVERFLAVLNCNWFGNGEGKCSWIRMTFSWLQKIFWILVIGFAVLDTCLVLKYPVLAIKQTQTKEESTYIESVLRLFQLVLLRKFSKTLSYNAESLQKLVQALQKLQLVRRKRGRKKKKINPILPLCMVASSLCLSSAFVLLGFTEIYISKSWEFKTIAQFHYQDIYLGIHDWSTNSTTTFSNEFTPSVTAYSTIGFLGRFGYLFTSLVLKDLFIVIALTLKEEIDDLDELREQFIAEKDKDDARRLGLEVLESYEALRLVSDNINDRFGGVITMSHANNMFLLVSFLDDIINNPDIGSFIYQTTEGVKSLAAYYICVKSSEKVEKLQSWLRYGKTRFLLNLDSNAVKFYALLDEMKSSPIGIGSGEYYINWQFVRKIAGLIMTYFFILAKSKKDQ